jgi:hypothetical protein
VVNVAERTVSSKLRDDRNFTHPSLGSFTWDLRRFSFSAQLFEIDDVFDHAETHRLITTRWRPP